MKRRYSWGVYIVKRCIDLCVAFIGTVLLLVMFPFLYLLIKLDSPGPVFYAQKRVRGVRICEDGTYQWDTFWLYKFRTMVTTAEDASGPKHAEKNDSRITKVGAFLRRYKIDEFPQFVHVLLGDMSVVGPRPERPELMEQIVRAVPYYEERCRDVKPGITGLAQVSLSYSGDFLDKDSPYKDLLGSAPPQDDRALSSSNVTGTSKELANKLLLDVAYALTLETFWSFLWMELRVIWMTPQVILFYRQGR